jgi:eukaryotic-like serine/threonine-protein kinase
LKKRPEERYATATALAQDLRRFLDHEPVSARADSIGYRMAKFARRHRVGVGAALTVAVAVSAGVAGTAWQANEAADQRDRALVQLRRAEAASNFVGLMLQETWGADERLTLDQFLQRSEQIALRSMKPQAEQQSIVLHSLGSHYIAMGKFDRAVHLLQQAVAALPPSVDVSWRAQVECNLALSTGMIGDAEAAQRTLARWTAQADVEPETAALCTTYRALLAQDRNDGDGALRYALQAQSLFRSVPQASPALLASLHGDLGYGYAMNNRLEEANREYAAGIRAFQEQGRGESTAAQVMYNNWAIVHWSAGDAKAALAMIDQVIALAERRGQGAGVSAITVNNRAGALLSLGRYQEAVAAADRAIAVAAEAKDPATQFRALLNKAGAQNLMGEFDAADRAVQEAQALARELPPGSSDPSGLDLRRAQGLLLRGQPSLARDMVSPRIAELQEHHAVNQALYGALRLRAEALQALREPAAALRDAQAALDIAQQLQRDRRYSLRTGKAWLLVAQIKLDAGDRAGARTDAAQAAEHLETMADEGHPDRALAKKLARSA